MRNKYFMKPLFGKHAEKDSPVLLRWTNTEDGEQKLKETGYIRLSYRSAVQRCCDERYARRHAEQYPHCGISDVYIYPVDYNPEKIGDYTFVKQRYLVIPLEGGDN